MTKRPFLFLDETAEHNTVILFVCSGFNLLISMKEEEHFHSLASFVHISIHKFINISLMCLL